MKKLKIAPAALLLLSVAAAAGCSRTDTLFTFWINASNDVLSYMNTYLIPAFKQANGLDDTVDISLLAMGGYDGLYDAITTAIPAGSTPTMAVAYPDHAATYVASNSLIDIEDYFLDDPDLGFTEEEGGLEDYVEAFVDEGRDVNGVEGLYTMPLYKSTEVMYYNRTYFAEHNLEIPTTWEELIDLAREIYDDDPEYWSQTQYYPVIWDSDSNLFITHAYQMDIPYTDPDQDNPFVFVNDENKAFVKELKELHDEHLFATKGSLGGTYSSTFLTEEQCIIAIGSSGGSSYNITNNFQLGVAPAPVFNTENAKYIQQGPDVVFFRRSSSESLEWAWKFYKFLTQTELNLEICATISYNPVRYSSYALQAYDDFVGSYAEFVDEALETDENGNLIHQSSNNAGTVEMTAYVAKDIISNDQLFYSPAFLGSAEARGDESSGVGGIIAGTLTYAGDDIDSQIDYLFTTAWSAAMQAQAVA